MLFNWKYAKFEAPDDATGSAGDDGTQDGQGTVTPVTPPTGAADGGKDYAKLYEDLQRKSQADINKLKSTLQSQQARQEKVWQQERAQMQEQLRQAQLSTLDEDERKEYLKNLEIERAGQYRQEAARYQQELEELKSAASYRDYFIEQGVSADKLVTDQGLDALVNSGWQGLQELMADMRSRLKQFEMGATNTLNSAAQGNPQSPAEPTRTPISATPAPAANGPNWDALIKQYGSAEEVYRLVETGALSPSIIPAA